MTQHLWIPTPRFRTCEVCMAMQTRVAAEWWPAISTICPGDDNDGGGRRRRPPLPVTPSGSTRELETA